MGVSAKVIADSKFRDTRLITLEVEMHRFILAENNTHKAQSRNVQSSRAIPVLRQLEQIANDPAMPVFYGKEQTGMVATEEIEGRDLELAKMIILGMRDACLNGVKQLQKIGLHKQISNRYVEPWMWTKGVVTATEVAWEAMFKLRCHYAAQPEIQALFDGIKSAIDGSSPIELKPGEWHTPYADACDFPPSEYGLLRDAIGARIKVSASCCAQVSYRRLDDSLEKAIKVYDMLNLPVDGVYPEDPPHFSPTEHIAKAGGTTFGMSGNFQCSDFTQYRKVLEKGWEKYYLN